MLQKAFDAFEKKDYHLAGSLWLDYISLSSNTSDLKKIEVVCKKADQAGIQNEWIYATIAAVYLDGGDYFMDRESALMEAITYAKKAIVLQPSMYQAHRFAGSACYWLGDYINAKKYYEQSIKILPDLVLLQRIIDCCKEINEPLPQVDLKIDFENTNPEYFYEQGVGANGLSQQNIPGISKDGALSLVRKSYERCYDLYTIQLTPPVVNKEGNIISDKHQHNLAMCCNNLSVIYNGLKMHNEALRVLNVGKQFSNFQALWENIRYTQCCLNNLDEETDAAIFLIENYDVSDELFYICMARICYYNMINKDYQDALDTANEAIEGYQNLSQQSQSNVTIVNCYAELYTNKIIAEKALGILDEDTIDGEIVDNALMETPDNVAAIIARGTLFLQQSQFVKSLDCFNQAIQFATEKNEAANLRDALMKRGFLKLYYLNKTNEALADFNKIEKMGTADFYIYYYQMNCHYLKKMHPQSIMAYNKAAQSITDAVEKDVVSMAQLYMMQGDTLFDLNKLADAIIAYQKSLQYQLIEGVQGNMELAQTTLAKQQNETNGGGFLKKLFG